MTKTGAQIQGAVFAMLRGSRLAREINGGIYRDGYRPRDSKKEDAIVIFTAGTADEVQEGVVTINIFVPDIDSDDDGTWIKNGRRTEQIEILAQEWFESLSTVDSNYLFSLNQAITTDEIPEIHQHFVVVRLGFRLYE